MLALGAMPKSVPAATIEQLKVSNFPKGLSRNLATWRNVVLLYRWHNRIETYSQQPESNG